MSTAPELIDPFHRTLRLRLEQLVLERTTVLAQGGALPIKEEVMSVAEKYAAHVSYIKAVRDIMELCEELERDRYGASPRENNEE